MLGDEQTEKQVQALLARQSKKFEFLLQPESYLLAAALVSGLFALPFLLLHGMALNCAIQNCEAMQGSTTADWLVFVGVTLFFVTTSAVSGWRYRQILKERQQHQSN